MPAACVAKRRVRRLAALTNKPDADIVAKTAYLAQQIVAHFYPTGLVLDPCRGASRPFFSCADCPTAQSEISEGRDFFDHRQRVDWIVTNPHWLKLAEFTSHAMALADEVPRCFVCIPLVSAYAIDRCRRIRSARGVAFRPSAETMAVIRISIGGGAHLTGAIKVRLRSSGRSSGWRSHG
jgi:hypothetical protein